MSDEETKPNERLESLLQRWGAHEAARQADVSHLSAPVPRRGRRPSPALRWMPLAASVALCAVAAALFLAAENGKIPAIQAGLTRSDPADKKRIEKLAAEVAALRAKLGKMEEQLAKTEDELAEAKIALLDKPARRTDNEIEALVEKRVAEAVKQYEIKLDEQWRKSREQLAEAQRRLDEAHKGRDQARVDLAEAKHRFAQEREQHEKGTGEALKKYKVQLAVAWLAKEKELDELKKQLAKAIKERTAAYGLLLQRAYLSGAAPGKEGYEARQHAARGKRLLDRCAELRPKLSSAEQRRAFDAIEVLLTRLDLLDVHDEAAVARFRALLKQVGVRRTVTKAWNREGADLDVNRWLLEITFLLTEY